MNNFLRMFLRVPSCPLWLVLLSFLSFGQRSPQRLGYPATARLLIIHADDLGMAHTVNTAIFEALENGWVTSASIMVPCPWFPEVARWSKAHPNADLGIHLTLDSEWTDYRWGPVAPHDQVSTLLDEQGYFPNDPSLLHAKLPEIDRELRAQIDRARAFGIPLTHLDSHMIALLGSPELFELYDKLGRDYGLPIRLSATGDEAVPEGVKVPSDELALDGVIGMSPGVSKADWLNWYKKQLAALKPGLYLLVVHIAHNDEEMQGATFDHPDWGAAWRQQDFDMVQSQEFRQFLKDQNFTLITWREAAKAFAEHAKSH